MENTFKQQMIAGSIVLSILSGGLYIGTSDVSATNTSSNEVKIVDGSRHSKGLAQEFSDSLLTLLKIDKVTLESKLAGGQSLAQIATQQGITREALKAELTKQASQNLDKRKTEFSKNVDSVIDSTQFGKKSERVHFDKGHGIKSGKEIRNKLDLTPIATWLGYSTATDFKTALQSGSSITELATAKKVDIQKIKDELTKQLQTHIDKKLADGSITQVKYNELKAKLPTRVTEILNKKNKNHR